MVIFVFVLVEIFLGTELARSGSPYPLIWLILHVLVAIGLVIGTGGVLWIALRLRSGTNLVIGLVTFFCALGATLAGTVFLFAGQSDTALLGMEVLGVLALIGALLLIVFGSVPVRPGLVGRL